MLARALLVLAAFLAVALPGPAAAQPPLLELSQQVVEAGATISVTVIGPPFHFYGVAISGTNSGLSGGGFDFELGPDFTVVGSGQLDVHGRATFSLPVAPTPNPLFVQGATSPDPGFSVFVPTPGKTITVGGQLFGGATQSLSTSPVFAGVNSTSISGSGTLGKRLATSLIARDCLGTGLQVDVDPSLTAGQQVVVTLTVNDDTDALSCTVDELASSCDSGPAAHQLRRGDAVVMRFDFTGLGLGDVVVRHGFLCH